MRARHLRIFLALAENGPPELLVPQRAYGSSDLISEQRTCLPRMRGACMRWGGESALSPINGVKLYWASVAVWHCAIALRRRLAHGMPRCATRTVSRSLQCRPGLLHGQYDEAIGFPEESLAIARESRTSARIEARCCSLVWRRWARRYHEGSSVYCGKRLRGPETAQKHEIAAAANGRPVSSFRWRVGRSRTAHEESSWTCTGIGDKELVAIKQAQLAMVAIKEAIDQAREMLFGCHGDCEMGSDPWAERHRSDGRNGGLPAR
jgi:hypothetical protein